MAFGVYISGTVTIGISRKIEYPSNKPEGSRGSIIRRDSNRHTFNNRMATDHVRRQYIQPGTSAVTNHRILRPPSLTPGAARVYQNVTDKVPARNSV